MNVRNVIYMVAAVSMCCSNVWAMEDVQLGGMPVETVGGMPRETVGGMPRETVGGMQQERISDSGRTVSPSGNQRGLTPQQINRGCSIVGENIECPGRLPEYRHTFEMPQFGQTWIMRVPGVAYTTEAVDGTRWLHTSTGARLPNNSLTINQNGTYLWKVREGVMQGRWVKRDDNHLILLKGYRGVDWTAAVEKFGADEVGGLLLWNDWDRLSGYPKK